MFDWLAFVLGVCSTAFFTYFGQILNFDNVAIVACRQNLLEIEALLQAIKKESTLVHKNHDLYELKHDILKKYKELQMHHVNLSIQHLEINTLIEKSIQILVQVYEYENQQIFLTPSLLQEWDRIDEVGRWKDDNRFKVMKKQFFYQSFVKRILYRLSNFKKESIIKVAFCLLNLIGLFFLYGIYEKGKQCKNNSPIVLISY